MVSDTGAAAGAATGEPAADPSAAARWRRRLLTGPDVVPSATTLRFATLVLVILASTGSLYGYLSLLVHPESDRQAARCMSAVRLTGVVNGKGPLTDTAVVLGCTSPYVGSLTRWSLSGMLLVAAISAVAYALTPWFILHTAHPATAGLRRGSPRWLWRRLPRLRREGLTLLRLDRPDQQAMGARVAELAERVGPGGGPRPQCRLNSYARDTGARAFGHQRRTYLKLDAGLLLLRTTDPQKFDGIVLHELGHLANRDNRPTYVTYAAWRTYVAVVVLPFLVAFFAPGVFRHPAHPSAYDVRARTPDLHSILALVLLTGLVYLTRNAVLRVRETHADARAALTDEAAVRRALATGDRAGAAPTPIARLRTSVGHHPSPRQRVSDLDDSSVLYAPGVPAAFAAGMAISLIAVNLGFTGWISYLVSPSGHGTPVAHLMRRMVRGSAGSVLLAQIGILGPAVAVALLLIVGFVCVTTWRAQLGVLPGGIRPSPWRTTLPLTAGLLLGQPLSVLYANAGTWGVFADGWTRQSAVVATTALTLAVIVIVLHQWATEAAIAWIPVSRRSLRAGIAATIALGALGAAPVFFAWFAMRDTVSIVDVSLGDPPAAISHWALAAGGYLNILPLDYLSALPGCAPALALPVLFVIAGASRRALPVAPDWAREALGPDPEPLARPARPARSRRPVVVASVAALLAVAGSFGFVLVLQGVVGGARLYAHVPDEVTYVSIVTEWIAIAACAGAAFAAGRGPGGSRLSRGLLAALITAALAGLAMPAPVYIGVCGTKAWNCVSNRPDVYRVLFGLMSQTVAVAGVALALCALLLARLLPPPRPVPPLRLGRLGRVVPPPVRRPAAEGP
ncbi:hypothetical protein GA0115240_138224, partial [Streptomyces sp. DvalAA-14]|uniref:M48 family metalloprotease n=1 Tax=unclassified Streptomyces TaxID=2593676 RepID=UPI00081BA204